MNISFNARLRQEAGFLKHLARFVRIKRMNRISIQAVAEHQPETEKWLLAYDCYQIEIIELASIIEVLFRDYFEALLFISCESKKDSFLEKIVRKYTGNDFMNIEKTNDIYKKAFGIEIRKNLNAETWDDVVVKKSRHEKYLFLICFFKSRHEEHFCGSCFFKSGHGQ